MDPFWEGILGNWMTANPDSAVTQASASAGNAALDASDSLDSAVTSIQNPFPSSNTILELLVGVAVVLFLLLLLAGKVEAL